MSNLKANILIPVEKNGKYILQKQLEDVKIELAPVDVKIKLQAHGKVPTKAHEEDAAYDIYANLLEEDDIADTEVEPRHITVAPHTTVKVSAGFSTEIPTGWVGHIYARSGLSTKEGLRPANCTSTIDAPYRGVWQVPIHNDSDVTRYIIHGERIAQFTIDPVIPINLIQVDKLSETERSDSGFGDSGKF